MSELPIDYEKDHGIERTTELDYQNEIAGLITERDDFKSACNLLLNALICMQAGCNKQADMEIKKAEDVLTPYLKVK